MLQGLIPAIIVVVTMFGIGLSALWIARRNQRGRRSPLTQQLLRSPGESLRQKIDELNEGVNECMMMAMVVPLALSVSFLIQVNANPKVSWFTLLIHLVLGLLFAVYVTRKLVKIFEERNAYRLGLDAELAVGQELNQLMCEGYRVFHDFPAEKFNIDHVVIGPGGVYAVETKGRAKPDRGRGKDDVRVVYDGQAMQFPDRIETAPIEQAKRQAEWLSKWLSSAVGTSVKAQGVLVFPGWYVDRKGSGPVMVISGKEAYHLKKGIDPRLNSEMVQRIAYQVEQRCRNVEPAAYRKH